MGIERSAIRRAGLAAASTCLLGSMALLGAPVPASPTPGSLYRGPDPRPGPDILYAKPSRAPQLQNRGPWRARPILTSGASAYRQGEFLYQDFLYDDHGARAARDPGDPRSGSDSFSAPNGTYTYPTHPAYANNAADLVELRVKPHPRATLFRITLNAMHQPARAATTIALGNSSEPRELPHGANARAPARLFLTVRGPRAELRRADDGAPVRPRPRAWVSKHRRQIHVRVPRRAWNPRRRTIRIAAAVGLWDRAADRYLIPQAVATRERPGGAGALAQPTAFFNVAFRHAEPLPDLTDASGLGAVTNPTWWRDKQQAAALAEGDLSPFFANVNFRKLRRGARDDMRDRPRGVLTRGPINRILASRFEPHQGADYTQGCGSSAGCLGVLGGRLQPYAIYVPRKPRPQRGWGLTLLLHSLAANYNQFSDSRNQSQLGERGPGSIVITPQGRGPDGWYYELAGADAFEVWADVARRYRLNSRWTAIAGYSMGGYGTYKFATRYPDLFAAGNPVVGPPAQGAWAPPGQPTGGTRSNTHRMLESLRYVPMMIWAGVADQLVPVTGPTAQQQRLDELGYRFVFDLFTADHLALAAHDQYAPVAEFLGTRRVNRNPARISYVVNPSMDFPDAGTVADHAYWLSGLRLRDASGAAPLGQIDARSHAFGAGDPEPGAARTTSGSLDGGNLGSLAFTRRQKGWGPAKSTPTADRLEIEAENLSRVIVDSRRARLSCRPQMDVETDGPLIVRLAGCGRAIRFDAGD
jgi:hypothetical protein